MAWGSVEITQPQDEWKGNKGRDPFKTKAHYAMLIVFICGILAILAVGIWIGVDLKRQNDSEADPVVVNPTDPATTTTPGQTTTTTVRRTTRAPTTTTTTTTTTATTTQPSESAVLSRLRRAVQSEDQVFVSNFSNWDGSTYVPKAYITRPTNAQEIQQLVLAANELKLKLRPTGTGLSYSNLFSDEGQIKLQTRNLLLRENGDPFTFDQASSTVSTAAGQTLGSLVEFLVANNIQVLSLPVVKEASVGGVMSTASHGKVFNYGTFSDQVVGVKYVDGLGNMQVVNTSTPEDLKRIRCCVGLCGIIYEVTLKVEPMKVVNVVQGLESGSKIIKNTTYLSTLTQNNMALEMFFAPLSSLTSDDWASYNATGQLPASYDPWADDWWYRFFEHGTTSTKRRRRRRRSVADPSPFEGGMLNGTSNSTERTQSTINTDLFIHKYEYDFVVDLVEALPNVTLPYPEAANPISTSQLFPIYSISYTLPDNSERNVVVQALEICFRILLEYTAQHKIPLSTIELRWLSTSPECIMCPASYSDDKINNVVTFELIASPAKTDFMEFAIKLTEAFRQEWPNTRLEWAKFQDLPDIEDFLYESRMDALNRMTSQQGNSTVQFWDVFMTELLSGVVYNS